MKKRAKKYFDQSVRREYKKMVYKEETEKRIHLNGQEVLILDEVNRIREPKLKQMLGNMF